MSHIQAQKEGPSQCFKVTVSKSQMQNHHYTDDFLFSYKSLDVIYVEIAASGIPYVPHTARITLSPFPRQASRQ